jgi:hypothetical protein
MEMVPEKAVTAPEMVPVTAETDPGTALDMDRVTVLVLVLENAPMPDDYKL